MQFRTETEILLEMVELAMSKGLISDDDDLVARIRDGSNTSNQYVLDLATHAHILSQLEEELSVIVQDMDVLLATGEALDRLGRLVGVARYSAQAPIVDLQLELVLGASSDLNIPAGTRVLYTSQEGMTDEYVTSEACTINEGTTSTSVRAECTEKGYHRRLEAESVYALEGVDVSVSNAEAGTNGRNIEEDDEYRLRVMDWASSTIVGTRARITDYLSHYDGLDSYKLIPRYDGVGTLKIVCDTLQSELANIASGVDENCMLATDYPTVCVLPESETLAQLELECVLGELGNLTQEELTQNIISQVWTYIRGGTMRNGTSYSGMGIGEDFYPSQLLQFLQGQFNEVLNFSTDLSVVSVPDTSLFDASTVVVSYD